MSTKRFHQIHSMRTQPTMHNAAEAIRSKKKKKKTVQIMVATAATSSERHTYWILMVDAPTTTWSVEDVVQRTCVYFIDQSIDRWNRSIFFSLLIASALNWKRIFFSLFQTYYYTIIASAVEMISAFFKWLSVRSPDTHARAHHK